MTIPSVMDGSHCSIFLRDKDGNFSLEATSAENLKTRIRKFNNNCLKYSVGQGKTGRIAEFGDSICTHGNITSEAGKDETECECAHSASAFLGVAIKKDNEQPDGVLRVVRSLENNLQFDHNDQKFLENFAKNLHRILTVYGYIQKRSCFVAMPFGGDYDLLYSLVIKPTVESFGFECNREDDYGLIGILPENIVEHISSATFLIADISEKNPNVHYELGIAHTMKKPVILLSQDKVASDIRHWKYISYQNTAISGKQLEHSLSNAIKEAKSKNLI